MKKNDKKIIWLGLTLSLFFFLIFVFTKDVGQNTNSISPPITNRQDLLNTKQVLPVKNQAFLEIDGKRLETTMTEKENIYDFMVKLKEEGKIDFKNKTYYGMGELIEEINGVKNSGKKNWIYYVNGQKAEVGISNYKINKGDIVSWKYEKNY